MQDGEEQRRELRIQYLEQQLRMLLEGVLQATLVTTGLYVPPAPGGFSIEMARWTSASQLAHMS